MKIRILLTDDASFIRDLIKRTLRKYLPQCEIMEASDGRKAQSILNNQSVDLILSDWEMPGVSGEELLRWVRAHDMHSATPFIMITSLGGKDNIMTAAQAGVSDYLGKPFTGEELMQKVQKALVKTGKLKAVQSSRSGGAFSSAEIFNPIKAEAAAVNSSTEALTGGRSRDTKKVKGTGVIKGSGDALKCMIKAVNIEEVLVIVKRPPQHPAVLQQVVMDISPSNNGSRIISSIPCYIHSVAAVEKKPDAEFLNILLRFTSIDKEQQEQLAQFVIDG